MSLFLAAPLYLAFVFVPDYSSLANRICDSDFFSDWFCMSELKLTSCFLLINAVFADLVDLVVRRLLSLIIWGGRGFAQMIKGACTSEKTLGVWRIGMAKLLIEILERKKKKIHNRTRLYIILIGCLLLSVVVLMLKLKMLTFGRMKEHHFIKSY